MASPAAQPVPVPNPFPRAGVVRRYLLSLAALLIPTAVALALHGRPALNPLVSFAFIAAFSGVAWWAGFWAGLLDVAASIPLLTLVATRGHGFWPTHFDWPALSVLVFICFLVSHTAEARRRAEAVLHFANAELDRKVQERTAELQAANRLLEYRLAEIDNVYQSTPVGLALLNRDLRVERINRTMAGFNRVPAGPCIGRSFLDIVPAALAAFAQPRLCSVLEGAAPAFSWEYPPPDSDSPGTDHQTLWNCSPVRAPEGDILGLQLTAADISELKRAQAALRESELRFRTMANSAPVMIWLSDAGNNCTWLNHQWLNFSGRTLEQDLGRGWVTLIHPADLQALLDRVEGGFAARAPVIAEYRMRRHDGQWRWVLTHATPNFDPQGAFLGMIGSTIDIQDRKLAEDELRRVNADLEQFAYSASHDLKEPMRTVMIYSEMLQTRLGAGLDAKARQALDFVHTGARRMDALIHDLMAYTQAGAVPETIAAISASGALQAALAGLAISIEESGAVVTADSLPAVRMSSVHLEQVFQNLVGNALKYRGDAAPRIHVGAGGRQGFHRFSVRDNGLGIEPDYKEQIFGIFKRLHTADRYAGTGVGLAICKRIVERYGGRIWVESQPGAGSSFFFEIPI